MSDNAPRQQPDLGHTPPHPSVVQIKWALIGALCCLPWAGALAGELRSAPASSIAGMVYLGVVPTALAFSTWAFALARTDAGRRGGTTYLVPPLVIGLGRLLLDEVPPALAVAGGAVCLAGVALSRRRGRPAAPVAVPQGSGTA